MAITPQDRRNIGFERDVAEYAKLREESEELNSELNNMDGEAAALTNDFGKRRQDLTDYINGALQEKHREQLKELHVKQKDEVKFLRDDRTGMQEEQEKQTKALLQKQDAKRARKEALQKELDDMLRSFAVDQLLNFMALQQHENKNHERGDRVDE